MEAGVPVSAAAEQLGLDPSRVRQLIAAGELEALKLASRWLVDPRAVERRRRAAPGRGRPLVRRNAWGLILLGSGEPAPWLDGRAASALRKRLRERDPVELAPLLRRRAEAKRLRAHPSDLKRVLDEPGVVLSGASAAEHYGADLLAPPVVEGYVSEDDCERIRRSYQLSSSGQPNVILRVVSDAWPFEPGRRYAPAVAAALDLLEAGDARSRRAGEELLRKVVSR